MSRVLIASITELCSLDHHGDAELIVAWTRNKSPESISRWLANPHISLLLAEVDGRVVAVGSINGPDEIGLNYVAPEARFRGVSKSLLAALEQQLRDGGIVLGRLTSTATAHRFYQAAGWRDTGEPETVFGLISYPMTKELG